jgi:hypothetical protein
MPFTISHAAAVLPLHLWSKARLPLAALMIGSMAPDFAYFMPGDPGRIVTHSVAGLFRYCLPASFVVWLLFVRVLEQPTIVLLPESWRSRFARSNRQFTLANLALVCGAIVLGGLTHLVWDSFTHRGTAVVHAFPVLRSVAFEVDGHRVRWFAVLQLLSSVFGLVVLAIWALRQPERASSESFPTVSHAIRVGAALLVVASTVAAAVTSYMLHADYPLQARAFFLAIGGMTGGALAWLAIALAMHWRMRKALTAPSSRA